MAQKKTTTPKLGLKSKPKAPTKAPVKAAAKAPVKAVSAIAKRTVKSVGQSFDVIPANKVVPSSSGRPVITSIKPVQADNTLTKHPSVMLKKTAAHTMAAAPRDISSGDVLLEDIAASLDKLQPSADSQSSTRITVRTSGPMVGNSAVSSPTGPTVAELLTAQTKAAPATTTASIAIAPTTVVGEKTIMPLSHTPGASDGAKKPAISPPTGDVLTVKSNHVKKDGAEAETHNRDAKEHKVAAVKDKTDEKVDEKPADQPVDKPADDDDKIDNVLDGLDLSQDKKPVQDNDGLPGKNDQINPAATHQLYGGTSVLLIQESHPIRTFFTYLFWFIGILVLALVVLNFLLDAGVVSTGYDIPYTDVLEP